MTDNNLCNSCANIGCEFQSGIVRTKCAFYMPPHIEPDRMGILIELVDKDQQYCLDYASGKTNIMALKNINRIIKAIADGTEYENRLKADMVAMLTELQLEIEERVIHKQGVDSGFEYDYEFISSEEVKEIIQEKINALRGEKE